jgi:tetratricopeptide (TPR) repeat protein
MKRALVALLVASRLFGQEESLLEQADLAFRNGDLVRSEALAQRVLARNPRAVHAHMILGVLAAQKKEWNVSDKHFQAVVKLEPSNPFGHFYLGQSRLYQQQWDAAIRYFRSALERQYPEKERVLVELALAQNEAGHPDHALATLHEAAPGGDDGLSAQYYAVTAFACAKLNQPGQSAEAIRHAVRFDPANSQYWEFLIGLLLRNDEAPLALAEAIRAQQKFPDNADIQFLFALASYQVTESPLSKLALRNLREADPKSPRVQLAEGLLYRKQAKTEEATQAFKLAAQNGVPDAHLLLAIVYKESGDYAAAERECREAERLNPDSGQVLLELGKLLLNRGELDEARIRLEKALLFMPDAASVHYQLGLLYRRLGQVEKAQEHLRKSKQQDLGLRPKPENP